MKSWGRLRMRIWRLWLDIIRDRLEPPYYVGVLPEQSIRARLHTSTQSADTDFTSESGNHPR